MDEAPPAGRLTKSETSDASLPASMLEPRTATLEGVKADLANATAACWSTATCGEAKSELPSPLRNASWCARSNA